MASASGDMSTRRLRVDLDIEPGADWDCPIVDGADNVAAVDINAVGDECSVDLKPADGDEVYRATGEVGNDCLCYVFQQHGCVPRVRQVHEGTMLVTTYVDDRNTVREIVEGLRDVLGGVRLVRLAVVEGPEATEQVTFDLSDLTPKQREGLELAVVRGYFDEDGGADLAELAAELGISKSALSQRLRTAQAKLVKDVFDDAGV
ncbi:dimethyl sulfoxide reductase transcriptional activator DmsR [Halorubrum gandharaense]